jgi:hypothetical protein
MQFGVRAVEIGDAGLEPVGTDHIAQEPYFTAWPERHDLIRGQLPPDIGKDGLAIRLYIESFGADERAVQIEDDRRPPHGIYILHLFSSNI